MKYLIARLFACETNMDELNSICFLKDKSLDMSVFTGIAFYTYLRLCLLWMENQFCPKFDHL